ncbi:MAG TPA: hypothetical protein VFP15_11675 [Gemmatimonadaceae bacterium]|nr:hypothetical protein [Gemmatimonadaceae bacterium]
MPLRDPARYLVRSLTIACAAAGLAASDHVLHAGEAGMATHGSTRGISTALSGVPADTVDSLIAARRATVMDRTPVGRRPAPRAIADSTAARDSAAPRAPWRIGPKSGDRHPAFRDTGSPLDSLWPVKGPAPLPGSILPGKRIVAFYGNPKSRRMGILGEFDHEEMLRKLDAEVAAWNRIDPATPAIPALHMIVLVADATPGPSGKYRTRHDSATIEMVYRWARSRNALMFVDLQVGQSTLQAELPWIEKFLIRPDVHLGIDPEFAMKGKAIPGTRVGTYDAADINYASRFLANLVDKYKLPPKILVVHRFTPKGVTHADRIQLDPRVQIVMDMDGFGPPWMKRDTYWRDIKEEPVQFTGWKQFTKLRNDKPPTPRGDILRLWPVPLYIQIQ